MTFIDALISDLNYPVEFQRFFEGIEKAEQLGQILKNKDALVKDKISSCSINIKGNFRVKDLVEKGLIRKIGIEEILVNRPFSLEGSLVGHKITIGGPIHLNQNVVIGRSVIFGPACVLESSRIHDSQLSGGRNGSVYIGKNCSIWDFTVIIRSCIGDDSLIHTCNINDSIVGSNCNFGGTRTTANFRQTKKSTVPKNFTRLKNRIILSNFSNGNIIKIYDPSNDKLSQTSEQHFGTVAGSNVWLGSGTIIYPGTIIGTEARINSKIPVIGYIPPKYCCSFFLSVKKDKKGIARVEAKGISNGQALFTLKR